MNLALFSESEILVKKKKEEVIKEIQNQFPSEIIEYNGSDKDFYLESIIHELNTFPFLSEHRIVIINNPIFLGAKGNIDDKVIAQFEAYLKDPATFSSLILYVDDFKVDNRKKIVKMIKKHMEVYEPKDLDDRTMENLIMEDLTKAKIELSRGAQMELLKRIIPQFNNWKQEFEKLKLYNQDYLEKEDVEQLISASDADNIFDLVSAVLDKNLFESLSIYRSLATAQKEAISLIMLLANQFRLVHQTQTLANLGLQNQNIASELKVHPYRVQLARNLANRYRSEELLQTLNALADLEQGIKGGHINPDIGFELFLIEVSQA